MQGGSTIGLRIRRIRCSDSGGIDGWGDRNVLDVEVWLQINMDRCDAE